MRPATCVMSFSPALGIAEIGIIKICDADAGHVRV
jgi:hypothetical protein